MKAYIGNFINPTPDSNVAFEENMLLVVDDTGSITHYAPATEKSSTDLLSGLTEQYGASGVTVLEMGQTEFMLPSFVDCHFHAPQYLNVGTGYDQELMQWLETYTFPAESKIDQDPEGLGTRVYARLVQRFLAEGITSVALYGTQSVEANMVLARACLKAGIRGLVGKVCQDQHSPANYIETTSDSLKKTETFLVEMAELIKDLPEHLQLVEPVITPRFLPTCTTELMKGLAEISQRTGVRLQTHMCEGQGEMDFSRSLYNGRTELDIFTELGYMKDRSLMAHCTHIDPEYLDAFKKTGVSVAHCPISNIYFSERPFPLREALAAEVKVGLGADVSGGYAMSSNQVMRGAVIVSKGRRNLVADGQKELFSQKHGKGDRRDLAITFREALYLSTLGGAKALNMDHLIGRFEVGKKFDAQLISLGKSLDTLVDLFVEERSTKMPFDEMAERWFNNGSSVDRVAVWVAGVLVASRT